MKLFDVKSLIVLLLLLGSTHIYSQAAPPYDICNNNLSDVYDVRYIVACSGSPAVTSLITIFPGTCHTIPIATFMAAGYVPGNPCEIEVQVLAINGTACTGAYPTCSSTVPSGGGCFSCFGTWTLSGMGWGSSQCNLW